MDPNKFNIRTKQAFFLNSELLENNSEMTIP